MANESKLNKAPFPQLLRLDSIIIFIVLCLLYVGTLSESLSISHDSIMYLRSINDGFNSGNVFHPHHLLFFPFMIFIKQIVSISTVDVSTMHLVEIVNAIAGSFAGVILFRIFRTSLQLSRIQSYIGVALCAFSYGFWYHSVCLEVCIIPLMFFLWSIQFSLSYQSEQETITTKTSLKIGLLHAFSILFHQVYVFQGLALLFAFMRKKQTRKQRNKDIAVYLLTTFCTVSIFYGYAIYHEVSPHSTQSIFRWLTSYAYIGTKTDSHFMPLSSKSVFMDAVGEARAISGFLLLAKSPLTLSYIKKAFPHKHFEDEEFLARHVSELTANLIVLTSLLLVLSVAIIFIIGVVRIRKKEEFAQRYSLQILYAALGIFTLFFTFWDSFNVEFWILQTTLLWIITVSIWSKLLQPRNHTLLFGAISVVLFSTNYLGAIKQLSSPNCDYYIYQAKEIESFAASLPSKNILLVSEEQYPTIQYLQEFTPFPVYSPFVQSNLIQHYKSNHVLLKQKINEVLSSNGSVIVQSRSLTLDNPTPVAIDNASVFGEKTVADSLASLWGSYRKSLKSTPIIDGKSWFLLH